MPLCGTCFCCLFTVVCLLFNLIGIFDSGIGGLTVVKEIKKQLPEYKLVYFGDTARLPYGTKTKRTIIRYSKENVAFLVKQKSMIIVVACNTASALAGAHLKKKLSLPVFDVIAPAVRAAKKVTRNKRIGVIGTPSTISSGVYQAQLCRKRKDYHVFTRACPLFVPLIEEHWFRNKETYSIAKFYLEPLKKKRVDTIILGCTHYPLLSRVIHDIMGEDVSLVSSAEELSLDLKNFIERERIKPVRGKDRFFVSDEPYKFERLSRAFLGKQIDVKLVRQLK